MCYISPVWSPSRIMAVLWVFMQTVFSLYKGLPRLGTRLDWSTEGKRPKKRKFAPTAPIAPKFRLGNTRKFFFPFVILLQDSFAPRANQRSQISATFPVWSHRLRLGLNSFFGSGFISGAAKTENPVPRSFFTPKPNGNACYAGY